VYNFSKPDWHKKIIHGITIPNNAQDKYFSALPIDVNIPFIRRYK